MGSGLEKTGETGPQIQTQGRKAGGEDWRAIMHAPGWPSIARRTARLKAIYLVQIAAEVEHALMAQYLIAAQPIQAAGRQDVL